MDETDATRTPRPRRGPGRPPSLAEIRRSIKATTQPESLAAFMELSSYRPETVRSYSQDVRHWITYARKQGVDLLNPTDHDVAHFVNVWHIQGPNNSRPRPSVAVRRNRRKALSAYSRHLVKAGVSRGYPLAGLRVEKDKTRRKASPRTLTPEEIHAFLEASRHMNTGAYFTARMLADLGPRTWELEAARRSSIHPTNRPPIIRLGGQGRGAVSDRELGPTTVHAWHEYEDWLKYTNPTTPRRLTDPLLMVPQQRYDPAAPINARRLERLVDRIAARAGLADPETISPRTFRQAWIRHALAVFHLTDVADAVGHLSPSSTLRYSAAGTVPVSPYAARVRAAVGGSVVRGVLLLRALEGGEPQPALREKLTLQEEAARLRSDEHLLRELEAARAETEALRRRLDAYETRAGTHRFTHRPPPVNGAA
ncbi:tyrosine-type recombinase/integrase [Streptomyces solisilvae]|uniref:tyrosine-type recombinase/integrase n=1 Tax=Streptomyces malaysiensis TaxID=92644 RepID=UPI00368FECCB